MTSARRTRSLIATLTFVSGVALGQDAQKPLLSGPEVEDSRPGLVEDSFGDMATGKARLGAMAAIPAQDLRKILQGMSKADAAAEVRLSEEQSARVRELMAEYSRERRAWMVEHKDELAELRMAAGIAEPAARGPSREGRDRTERNTREGDEPRRGKPESEEPNMMEPIGTSSARRMPAARMPAREGVPEGEQQKRAQTPEQQAVAQRLREFMSKGPSTGDLQRRIYAEFSPAQQKHVDDEVRRMADERGDQREMEKIKRRQEDSKAEGAKERGEGQPARAGGAGRIDWDAVLPADGSVNLDALPERARKRLESMGEAEQKRALEAFRKRSEQQGRNRGD
jgi:hypothetical protein